MMVSSVT